MAADRGGKSWMAGQAEESILQVRQLTEPERKTKECEKYPIRFQHLYEIFSPETSGRHCREWPAGKDGSEMIFFLEKTATHRIP